jgi:HAD superfamily hydrolase (TIGR01509 family)
LIHTRFFSDRYLNKLLLIFDFDGTLVDSEILCNQAFIDLLPELQGSAMDLSFRYRGMKLSLILEDISGRIGRPLSNEFVPQYRGRVAELFESGLRPISGVAKMLSSCGYPRCIASSGSTAKIRHGLRVCGLSEYFGDDIFSSYDINSWKPDPDLFLHAAKEMGFASKDAIVIEDSEVGIRAALAAGMCAVQYVPDGNPFNAELAPGFGDMALLPSLIQAYLDKKTAQK